MARRDLQPYPVNVTLAMTQADIDFGIAQDSYSCAIACAIYRTFPDARRVRVTQKTIAWSDASTDVRYVYPTPPRADQNIIKPFDLGSKNEVKPQRITLTSGQFRNVIHDSRKARHERERARQEKRDNPEAYQRRHSAPAFNRPNGQTGPGGSSKVYDRYVPTREDL